MDNAEVATTAYVLLQEGPKSISELTKTLGVLRRRLIRILSADQRFARDGAKWSVAAPAAPDTKMFKRRDTGTAALKKLGIAKEDYDTFITPVDGGVSVDLEAAKASLEEVTA